MIPLKLTLEGIYSYQDRQTIDFTDLTSAGLFGIFGPTGSGKSSILEAISFALYGETERLNARDKRAYNMMNLKSKRSYLEFDFENHEGKRFRASREFKRNSKNFEDVKPTNTAFYEWVDNNWLPLNHTDAERILGLSYKNFKRTIIIPQGQFKDFLELGAKERTEMMKEIFQLERFDLGDKVSVLKKTNQSELDVLEGKLSGFEEVNPEVLGNLEKQKTENAAEADKIEKNFKEISEHFHHLELLKKDFETLQIDQSNLSKLTQQIPKFEQKEKTLERFETFSRIFSEALKTKIKLKEEAEKREKDLEIQRKILVRIQTDLQQNLETFEKLKPEFEKLPEQRILENDLTLMIKILTGKEEISELNRRTEKGNKIVKETQDGVNELQSEISTAEIKNKKLTDQKLDTELLLQIDSWFNENQHLIKQKEKLVTKSSDLKTEIENTEKQLSFESIEKLEENFQINKKKIDSQINQTNLRISHLEVQKQLSKYAHELSEGDDCPLCGSPHHPHIAEFEDVSLALENLKTDLKNRNDEEQILQKQKVETLAFFQKIAIRKESRDEFENELKILNLTIEKHLQAFVWGNFNPNDPEGFQKKKSENNLLEKDIKNLNQTIIQKRKTLEQKNNELEKYRKTLEEFKIKQAQKQAEIDQNHSNIQQTKLEDYEGQSIDNVIDALADLKNKSKKIEQNYMAVQEQIAKQSPQVSAKQAEIKTTELYLNQNLKELEQTNNVLDQALESHQVAISEVQITLALNLDIPKIRSEISQFRIDLQTLQNKVNALSDRLKTEEYSEEKFLAAQDQKNHVEEKLKSARENLTKIKAEFERLTKAFEQKKELLKKHSELEKRAQNLQVLSNLFKGAGFVQFVSSIYLRQLCDHANVRFTRMTRNQLSLQVNENNDFEIIDYLNEGRNRSVKTLSGGQAFQVSLSLALALAESVQSSAKAEKNFFFIDEGFGTQDQESVNLVFETLQNLQKENRIVGIISHVEELKEKIPVSLTITKDEQYGSLIALN